ncbi:MAG: DUF211 domain-containing protein [Candidatus Bathyarchaeia archaeon]
MSVHIRRILFDALKPRETSIVDLSKVLCSVKGVEECDIVVVDVDVKTETVKVTIRGLNVDYEAISKIMEEQAVSIKGIDEINVAKSKPPPKPPTK